MPPASGPTSRRSSETRSRPSSASRSPRSCAPSKELRTALALDPFPVAAGDTYFLTFLQATPTAKQRAALEALSNDYDTLVVKGRDVHWRMHGLSSATTIPTRAWEQVIGRHTSTSRNTTMLRKLVAKVDARGGGRYLAR